MTVFDQGKVRADIVQVERTDFTPADQSGGDHSAHAAGQICRNCDRRIEAGQPARRRGDTGWAHDVCPQV